MAAICELHMVRDWGSAWGTLVQPWLQAPAGLRRDYVLVPTRGQAHALKLRCVREGVPLLGVEFLTPNLAREKWHSLAPPARPSLGRELLLLNLRTLLAERQAPLQPEDHAWGLWQSLRSDPEGALNAFDELLAAGGAAEDFPLPPLRSLFAELEQRVAAAGYDLAPRIHRSAALAALDPSADRLDGRLLIYGFSAENQREFPVLAGLARRSPDLRMLVPEPTFTGQGADERWIELWEKILGIEATPAESPETLLAGQAVADVWGTGAPVAAVPAEILIGTTRHDEMQLLAARLEQLLAGGADNVAVVFPLADAAHHQLVHLLAARGLPFNDLVGLVGTPSVDVRLQHALVSFLARGARLEELLALWPLLHALSFTTLATGEARDVVGRVFDETQTHALAANLTILAASTRPEWREVTRIARLLPPPWPDRLPLARALEEFAGLCTRFRQAVPEAWLALRAYTERDQREFSAAAILTLLATSLRTQGAVTDAPGRGLFAPLTLTTRRRAAALEWSHLFLVEANAGVWPAREESVCWLTDEARLAFEAARGRPPGGLLTAEDRAILERTGYADLARQTSGSVAFTAARYAEDEPELPLAPNAWLERVLLHRPAGAGGGSIEQQFAALVRSAPSRSSAAPDPTLAHWNAVHRSRRDPSAAFNDWFLSADPAAVRPERVAARLLERAVSDPAELWFEGVLRVHRAEWEPLQRARHKALGSLAHRLLAAALRGRPAGPVFMERPEPGVALTQLAEALASMRAVWPQDRYWDSFAAELSGIATALLAKVERMDRARFVGVEVRVPEGTALALGGGGGKLTLSGRMDLVLLDRPEWAGAEAEIVDFKTGSDQLLTAVRMARGASLQLGLYLAAARTLGVATARVWLLKPDASEPSGISLGELDAALAAPLTQLGRHLTTGHYGALTPDRTEYSHGFEWPLACPPVPHAVLAEKFARTFGSAPGETEASDA